MTLLDGIDAIDWRRYHHAYGPAVDVPDLLRALASDDLASKAIRASAKKRGGADAIFKAVAWQLWGNVFHQGSVWGVTAKVVPFLAELLGAGIPVGRRRFLVTYLHHLARGYPKDEFPQRFDIEGLLKAGAEVEALGLPQSVIDGDAFGKLPRGVSRAKAERAMVLWMRDSYLAVEAALPTVRAHLGDPDDELVREVIALLASFHRDSSTSVAALWPLARREPASITSAAALVALAQLGAEGVVEAAATAHESAEAKSPARAYAAAAAMIAAPRSQCLWAQNALLCAPIEWAESPCAFSETVGNLVNRLLLWLPADARAEAVATMGRNLEREQGFGKLDAFAALLAMASIEDPKRLDSLQREVVRLLAAHGDWPADGAVNGNQATMLRNRDLPTTREGLRALLERREK